jgi:Divergent InlB B-repeat domain
VPIQIGTDAAAKARALRGPGFEPLTFIVSLAFFVCALVLPGPAIALVDDTGKGQAILTVAFSGRGQVTSSPPAIGPCTPTVVGLRTSWSCSFEVDESVALTAQPAPGWKVDPDSRWTGCEPPDPNSTCTVVVPSTGASVVAPRFIPTGILRIWSGGVGRVRVSPAGVNDAVRSQRVCSFTARIPDHNLFCTLRYPAGTRVTMRAVPLPGSKFFRWSESCVQANPCTARARLSRPSDDSEGSVLDVVAVFSPVMLIVDREGVLGETGFVTSSPIPGFPRSKIRCPPVPEDEFPVRCRGLFPAASVVTLTAHSDGPVQWGFDGEEVGVGCFPRGGDPASRRCVTRAHTYFVGIGFGTAGQPPTPFDPTKLIRVTRGGNKRGTVTGPDGIDGGDGGLRCGFSVGNDCAERYHVNRGITLIARAKVGSVFSHWRYAPCLPSRRSRFCSFHVGSIGSAQAVFVRRG